MRIIKGEFQKRRILTPKGMTTRPTPEVVREALFNILGESVIGASFLDLFAGSGGMGLEAISRGAEQAVFVECGTAALKVLRKNVQTFGCGPRAWVVKADAYRRIPPLEGYQFPIIFAAPPYDNFNAGALLMGLLRSRRLTPDGVFILQQPSELETISDIKGLVCFDQRRYGRNQLSLYQLDREFEAESYA